LARILKELLLDLGLSDTKADVLAQVHLQQTSIPSAWSEFIIGNCTDCAKSPDSCDFLNPKPENCIEGATPSAVRSANAMVIERGSLTDCPSRVDPEESRITTRQPHTSAVEGEQDENA
ncbi:MAG TPA: hypothetical protein VLA34_03495, partial [Candidatus Krumholzibacterium sp.]|nr:hypothetical protein [Candidatus Krumholzibacterium sp.]